VTTAAIHINGDGKADIIMGAYLSNSGTGAAYVVFGKASGWSSSYTLTAAFLDGVNGIQSNGVNNGDGVDNSLAAGEGYGLPRFTAIPFIMAHRTPLPAQPRAGRRLYRPGSP
jgi:FG-GAP repeat